MIKFIETMKKKQWVPGPWDNINEEAICKGSQLQESRKTDALHNIMPVSDIHLHFVKRADLMQSFLPNTPTPPHTHRSAHT